MSRTSAAASEQTDFPAIHFVGLDDAVIKSNRLIKIDVVLSIIPTTRQTIYRWMEAGKFPKPVKIGDAMIGFREAEVVAWLNDRPRALGGEAPAPRGRRGKLRATA